MPPHRQPPFTCYEATNGSNFSRLLSIDHAINGTNNRPWRCWVFGIGVTISRLTELEEVFFHWTSCAPGLQNSAGLLMPGIFRSGSLITMMVLGQQEWIGWYHLQDLDSRQFPRLEDLTWALDDMPHLYRQSHFADCSCIDLWAENSNWSPLRNAFAIMCPLL